MREQQVAIRVEDGVVSITQLTEEGMACEGDDHGLWTEWEDFDNFEAAFAATRHILSE